ncbi:MAG: Teichoic acid biosynthesis protein [Candidatus Wolfebacteria bacterium GW2011_GWB1_41_12]|uniref:Teichoic acid biosynthesis protein n=1 Tax=Candidatus Wolfebacteria bacterium GW2011_GWB1_41_12 TaxID=1619006 RepID=A0A0G0WUZ3_9BACT|nr:MAG: Teichoic acid biosynthesis protein [Candidatus Wolfebacteria bacterium GW2011_GWB1_41_12]
MLSKKIILGVGVIDVSFNTILEYLVKKLKNEGKKFYLVTPNPELLMIARRDESYKKVLNNAELALPDGIGVVIAGKILGKPLKARITGVDFVYNFCNAIAKQPITVGFLGGGPNVAEKASKCLIKKYPGLKVGFAYEDWPPQSVVSSQESVVSCDLLFVAFGSPKQEKWIAENLDMLPVKAAMGVGGAFDFISGKVRRAPKFVRGLGLEWLFRLAIQPWRIKRQVALIKFTALVIKEKLL